LASTVTTPTDYNVWLSIKEGRSDRRVQLASGAAYDVEGCCPVCDLKLIITAPILYQPEPPYYPTYNSAYNISWNTIPGASSYTLTVVTTDNYLIVYTSPTAATLYISNVTGDYDYPITVYANGTCAFSTMVLGPTF
jgi:hypothetical protein